MSQPPLVRFNNVYLAQTGGVLFDDVTFSIRERDRICLIGRNGSGKSTLLKCIAGVAEIDGGERLVQPGLRIGLLSQEPDLSAFETVLDYGVSGGAEPYRLRRLAEALHVKLEQAPAGLSGGETRRAALAKILAEEPDLLLLDEPTNHLDIDSIRWLEAELKSFSGAVLTISHDRTFLTNTTKGILWLDRGRVKEHSRGFAHFDAWSEQVINLEAEQLHKMDKLIAEETIWSRQGISARRKRNQGRLRRLSELREQRAGIRTNDNMARMTITSGESSGKIAIEATELSKSYSERKILKPFSTKIIRGDRVGIVGPNGAGKSTLLNLLLGRLEPDTGTLKLGTKLTATFIDQKRDSLKPGLTAWDYLADSGGDSIMVNGNPRHVVTYMQEFLFSKTQARSPVEALSGGERNRLTLAKAVANPTNLLVLDEPTNDLDIETLDLLQEMLGEYEGTILLVSHDRDFIDRIVTSTIILDGEGGAYEYPGGYSQAMQQHLTRDQTDNVPGKRSAAPNKPAAGKATKNEQKAKKLTYAQEIRLRKLPALIEAAEAAIATLEAQLGQPDFYAKDPDTFTKTSVRIGQQREALEALEMEWLGLEDLAS